MLVLKQILHEGSGRMAKLSVVIITENEEKVIADATNCVSFTDEVVELDCFSTDKTCYIAEELGARVTHQGWPGSGTLKNKVVKLAHNDWVFVLKVNERITSELQAEILSALQDPSSVGYSAEGLSRYFDKDAVDHGLYPGYSLHMFNRQHGKFINNSRQRLPSKDITNEHDDSRHCKPTLNRGSTTLSAQ